MATQRRHETWAAREGLRLIATAAKAAHGVTGLLRSFHRENAKRQRDPHTPAIRSKGEKARNRRNRH